MAAFARLAVALALAIGVVKASHHNIFDNVTIFTPPPSWENRQTSYGRTVLLNHQQDHHKHHVMLSTWSFGAPGGPYLPIFKSTNEGESWSEYSKLYFTHQNYTGGGIWQPSLYELPRQVGDFPTGTILASGNAIPQDFSSTNIEVYASRDGG